MSKSKWIVWAALIAFIAGMAAAISLPAQALKLCCVAGKYEGYQVNTAKPNCPAPAKEPFTMVIEQELNCGPKLKGTILDIAGTVNHWTGTLTRGLRRCCKLEGSFLTPGGNPVKFTGSICRNSLGKWQAKGTWVEVGSTDPCKGSGTWQMTQV